MEHQIQFARRYYNAVVRDLNVGIAQFPSNLVVALFGVRPREFFEAGATDRSSPEAKLGASAGWRATCARASASEIVVE